MHTSSNPTAVIHTSRNPGTAKQHTSANPRSCFLSLTPLFGTLALNNGHSSALMCLFQLALDENHDWVPRGFLARPTSTVLTPCRSSRTSVCSDIFVSFVLQICTHVFSLLQIWQELWTMIDLICSTLRASLLKANNMTINTHMWGKYVTWPVELLLLFTCGWEC